MKKVYGVYHRAAQWLVLFLFVFGVSLTAQAQRVDGLTKQAGPVDGQLLTLQDRFEAFSAPGAFASDNPLMRVKDGYVVIDAVADGNADGLLAALKRLGLQDASTYGAYVSGRLPISSIRAMSDLSGLKLVRPSAARTNVGLTTSQGVQAMNADDVQTILGITGNNVWVGVLSDTFDDWDAAGLGGPPLTDAAADIANGDLPPNMLILDDSAGPGIDEGRAMMQIVYDVAPGANLSFHTAFGGFADFAQGIEELAGCPPGSAPGCVPSPRPARVVVDDVIYFAEAMFQDDIIAQAADNVFNSGRTYFSSAGNNARQAYQRRYVSSGIPGLFGGIRHDFDPGPGVDDLQRVTIPVGDQVIISFQWTEPFFSICGSTCCPGGSQSDLDIILYDVAGGALAGGVANNLGGDAVELFGFLNDGTIDVDGVPGPDTEFDLGIELFAGPRPRFMKYVYFDDMTVNEFDTQSGTVYGHANANGAEAVGAAFYQDTPPFGTFPPVIESFSSAGFTPEFIDGSCNFTGRKRAKPEIVAPDGANTTFFFPFSPNPEGDAFPNFFGTSAAAPHAAGVAALINEAAPGIHPKKVYKLLERTAIDMDDPFTPGFDNGFDFGTGYGLINAYRALCRIVPCPSMIADEGEGSPEVEGLETQSELPTAFALDQNYPNPFNPRTLIEFALPETREVELAVFDVMGRRVATLVDGVLSAGYHEVAWNAEHLPTGVYLYRITAGDFMQVKQMMLVK